MKYLRLYPEILLALFTIKCIAIGNISIGDSVAFTALIAYIGYQSYLNRNKTTDADAIKKEIADLRTAVRNLATERPSTTKVSTPRPTSWSGNKNG